MGIGGAKGLLRAPRGNMYAGKVSHLIRLSIRCCALRCSTLLYSTLRCSTLLYSTLLYSTLLYSTLLYCTANSIARGSAT
jgi:hypothetical protein